jgi:hypothetical protein
LFSQRSSAFCGIKPILMVFSRPGETFHFTTRGFEDAATNETVVSAERSTYFKSTNSNPFETSSGRSR